MNKVSHKKKYFGVYFKGGSTWAVVPRNWIIFPQRSCYWPNKGEVEDLARLMINPEYDWSIWPISKIPVESGE